MLKPIAKLFLALNGNVKKEQVAAGIAWGLLLGLVPTGNIFFIVLFLVSFFFRNNHGAKIFGLGLVKILKPLIVYGVDGLGWAILHNEALQPFFTTMYNMPFVPFTNFNNTLVIGGLAAGLILWLPSFLVFIAIIPLYRNHVAPKLRESEILKKIAKFPLLKLIQKSFYD